MKCCSFFAGAGGIDLGFEQAGFKTVFANELDNSAVQTLKANFDFEIYHGDIRDVEASNLPEFEILLAGFPCQAFSIAGKGEGFNDAKGRGDLFFEVSRILKTKRPPIVFLENVKNLVQHDNGNTFKVILKELKNIGYHVKYKVLNAYEYGNVPQNRERIYIVGFLDPDTADKFTFPAPIPLQQTLEDILVPEDTVEEKFYYRPSSKIFPHLENTVINPKTIYQWRRKYIRENKKGLCPTLTANMGTGGHNVPLITRYGTPESIRKLTPRECFNFQGYPSDFILPKTLGRAQLYKQAGNSVVIPVIQRIAEQIKLALNR